MTTQPNDYRVYMLEAYELKKQTNPRYSMRAFARDLGLASSTLSEILKRHHTLSVKSSEKVLLKINLAAKDASNFRKLVDNELFLNKTTNFRQGIEQEFHLNINAEDQEKIKRETEDFFQKLIQNYNLSDADKKIPIFKMVNDCLKQSVNTMNGGLH